MVYLEKMRRQICLIWLLIVYAAAIRVKVEDQDVSTTTAVVNETSPTPDAPIYYESDEPKIDSYLIPPSPHTTAEDKQDLIPTYLLPPTQDKQEDFYVLSANTGTQTDWYPIQQSAPLNNPNILTQPSQNPYILSQSLPQGQSFLLPQAQQDAIPILMMDDTPPRFNVENTRRGKAHLLQQQLEIPVPSRHLEPPLENAENHFLLPTPSVELELPYQEQHQQFVAPSEEVYELPTVEPNQDFNPLQTRDKPLNFRFVPAEPTLSLHLTPPKPLLSKQKKATKLYPKKYPVVFKPVPIPISQFSEESLSEVPKAKPVKPFNPADDSETEYSKPIDKETYLYEKAKQKRKLRKEKAAKLQLQQLPPVEEPTLGPVQQPEQETSETHFRYPGRNVYPAPLRQAPPTAPPRPQPLVAPVTPPPQGDRTEFRMHGMKGPHSYQFGYDTGKGKNRQFRFEERDNDGHVRGHYGYVDKHGKLRVVNYDADPLLGFRAEAPVETEP